MAQGRTERQKLFNEIRKHLRKAITNNIQAINALEDYKYPDTLRNVEEAVDDMVAAGGKLKKL